MSALVFSSLQMTRFSDVIWRRFVADVTRQISGDVPKFDALTAEQKDASLSQSFKQARHYGFQSERSLAFWANLTWRLPVDWYLAAEVQVVLVDRIPSEAERLFRLKLAVEDTQWSG